MASPRNFVFFKGLRPLDPVCGFATCIFPKGRRAKDPIAFQRWGLGGAMSVSEGLAPKCLLFFPSWEGAGGGDSHKKAITYD